MTAKPIPEWAIEAANNVVDHGGADRALIAALLVSTREAALREALRLVKAHLGDGECHDICDCEGYFDKAILALIDRSPS